MPAATTIDLLPIFRTDAQWLVLTYLFVVLGPDEDTSVAALSRDYGIPVATLNDEVRRLIGADLIRERRVGRTRLLRANLDHPAATALRMLLAQTSGPLPALSPIAARAEVRRVEVFGSWARRYRGEPGPFPRDVDVLVVVDTKDDDVELDLRVGIDEIASHLGVTINPWIVSASDVSTAAPESVLAEVLAGPLVEVPTRPASSDERGPDSGLS